MSKYDPLQEYLTRVPTGRQEVTLTFLQIAKMMGQRDLCDSAYEHRPWWGNQTDYKKRPQAKAWMEAGWKVEDVRQNRGTAWVKFVLR